MAAGSRATTDQFRVVVSEDRIRAWIELPGSVARELPTPSEENVLTALTEKGINVTDTVRACVQEFVQLVADAAQDDSVEEPGEVPERFLVAEGRPAVEACDAEFEWDERFDQQKVNWHEEAPVDYYTRNSILTVEAGTLVGRISPATDGEVGEDVYGQEVRPRRANGVPLKLGSGLRAAEDDPQQVITEVAGRLERDGSTLFMTEVLTIPGDVDFEFGNVDSCIDVHIRGGVNPCFSVKTTKSMAIERAVEAAELVAGGDIAVRGGLFGQACGRLIKAGGSITASICDAADLEAGGDINVSKEIVNSTVHARGQLRIERGSIVGGEIYAREGVKLKNAGSDLGVPTRIAVGTDRTLLYQARQLERQARQQRRQAEQIRTRVGPLVSELKRLTPAQREQATGLMCKADEMGRAAEKLATERNALLEAAKPEGNPGVEVTGTLYPGVMLVFGLRETTIKNPLQGPLRVEIRQVENVTEITAVDLVSASLAVLPSVEVDVDSLKKSEQQPAEPGGAA